nr:hypothetical protein [Nocardia rhamnosiphila]
MMVSTAHRPPEPGFGLLDRTPSLQHEREVVHRRAVIGGDGSAVPRLGRGGLAPFLQQDRKVVHRLGEACLGRAARAGFGFDRIAPIFQ